MVTRSLIAYQDPTTKEYFAVYCHWDGYVSHNGQILEKVYNNLKLVENLVARGDMSNLVGNRETGGALHYIPWGNEDWETLQPYLMDDLESLFHLAKNCLAEYLYVFADGKWLYSNTLSNVNSLQSLTDAVECINAEDRFPDDVISQIKEAVNAFYG